ncbi:MAG: DsrE family protein [Verrucomicrobiota bacterium]|nr:DsrE family protein [Verrucomicrobiota bacterium]
MRTPKFIILLLALGMASLAHAQEAKQRAVKGKHRILFEVTMAGEKQWTGVLNNVENVREALGQADTEVFVVAHSNGLGMLVQKDNPLAERIKGLADDGVVFAACENTMKKKHVRKEDLLRSATTVDSGVAEVVRKEEAGWSYIKSGS